MYIFSLHVGETKLTYLLLFSCAKINSIKRGHTYKTQTYKLTKFADKEESVNDNKEIVGSFSGCLRHTLSLITDNIK